MRMFSKIKLNPVALFLLLGLALISSAQAEVTTTYYHTDAAGSVVAASDQAGALLWRKSYSPYGEKVADGEGDANAVSFTGKQHDDVTGLTNFGARYYDPEVGRFMGMDAVGFQDDNPISFNRFAYANNNPYRYKDPDGNIVFLIPVVMFIAKEVAGEVFERTTGIPAVFTVKGAAKAGLKLLKTLGKKGGKAVDDVAKNVDTLQPGKYAGKSIPANGPGRNFTKGERDKINDIGQSTGCHTCGATNPGTKSGNHIPDHQPANALNSSGGSQRLFPHCKKCSSKQGGQVTQAKRRMKKDE